MAIAAKAIASRAATVVKVCGGKGDPLHIDVTGKVGRKIAALVRAATQIEVVYEPEEVEYDEQEVAYARMHDPRYGDYDYQPSEPMVVHVQDLEKPKTLNQILDEIIQPQETYDGQEAEVLSGRADRIS